MAFYGYNGDVGECYWTPYNTSSYDYDSDFVSPQSSVTYSSPSYEFEEPKLIAHSLYSCSDSSPSQQVPNYFVYNYTQPRVIQYEPPLYSSTSFYCQTNYNISNSTIKFDEPVFEEYDPTPYGGGYDIAQTYGKPLPPSDEICYPRSTAPTNVQLSDGFSNESIPSPYRDSDYHAVKPHREKDNEPVDNQEKQTPGDNGDKVIIGGGNTGDIDLQKPMEVKNSDVEEHPSSDYSEGHGSGGVGGYGYDWNRQVSYIPYGSGLEAMDLCESIFGYWPCLAKINRQRNENCAACNDKSQNEPWKSAADYLFGSPFAYGGQKDGSNGYNFYDYQPQHPYQ